MKLSRIYCNFESDFHTIDFNSGFNVVIGEILNPDAKNTDAHNLGKSKLSELIDFCLLKGRSKTFFLFQFYQIFEKYVFFLELKLNDGSYLTVRRSVEKNTKIALKKHFESKCDLRGFEDSNWDYCNIPIDRAKLILDSYIGLFSIAPWTYRDAVAYCLRSQDDYTDIFQLDKFRGTHLSWKPYLGRLLGFEASNLTKNYLLRNQLDKLSENIAAVRASIGALQSDQEEILTALLDSNKSQARFLDEQLSSLNFDKVEQISLNNVADNIDSELDELTKVRYYLVSKVRKLEKARVIGQAKFNIEDVSRLFEEAGILFGDQVVKSYGQLSDFNEKISIERDQLIAQQLNDLAFELEGVSERISELNEERSRALAYLRTSDVFLKYKGAADRLAQINASIAEIQRKLDVNDQIRNLEQEERDLLREKRSVVDAIRQNRDEVVRSKGGIYQRIKDSFVSYVSDVLGLTGILRTEQNSEGNLEYYAGILGADGCVTGQSEGHSYKKILCIGFDLAVMEAYSSKDFVRFLYHDGGLETLDDRKKIEFIEYVRAASNIFDFQYILTLIDSDLPKGFNFSSQEVVRKLSDNGPEGRLFNIPAW
ncbi:DUF2326 domain-containing protein [Pseudomonas sp. PDM23]|uniref:DUF2326 domain-containing protein n=1 Tax=Pseudomonas sp. PDM23 TaxID=2769275 RepID=UPI001780C002|nr:DUF2326 domain-containing protein [Pseudomonas sp. PDM23]MBD9577949.1 DUF2326 domain-containing protein [Pseudomonas sp. PDM23]